MWAAAPSLLLPLSPCTSQLIASAIEVATVVLLMLGTTVVAAAVLQDLRCWLQSAVAAGLAHETEGDAIQQFPTCAAAAACHAAAAAASSSSPYYHIIIISYIIIDHILSYYYPAAACCVAAQAETLSAPAIQAWAHDVHQLLLLLVACH